MALNPAPDPPHYLHGNLVGLLRERGRPYVEHVLDQITAAPNGLVPFSVTPVVPLPPGGPQWRGHILLAGGGLIPLISEKRDGVDVHLSGCAIDTGHSIRNISDALFYDVINGLFLQIGAKDTRATRNNGSCVGDERYRIFSNTDTVLRSTGPRVEVSLGVILHEHAFDPAWWRITRQKNIDKATAQSLIPIPDDFVVTTRPGIAQTTQSSVHDRDKSPRARGALACYDAGFDALAELSLHTSAPMKVWHTAIAIAQEHGEDVARATVRKAMVELPGHHSVVPMLSKDNIVWATPEAMPPNARPKRPTKSF